MPSFDIESKIDNHELSNSIDQTNRVVSTRYDLKDANSKITLQDNTIKVSANETFQLEQIIPVLKENLSKRKIDLKGLRIGDAQESNNTASVDIELIQGISKEIGKEINALIKSKKMKVQSSIQGDSVRVTGKKRDDLQDAILLIKDQNFDIPLQFQILGINHDFFRFFEELSKTSNSGNHVFRFCVGSSLWNSYGPIKLLVIRRRNSKINNRIIISCFLNILFKSLLGSTS